MDADALQMCREMCEEVRGVAACHVLGGLTGSGCPLQHYRARPLRRVVYSDRFVERVREMTGDARFPLRAVED